VTAGGSGIVIARYRITQAEYFQGLDPDAAAYIEAVEAADGQSLENGVVLAINDFVLACKADGNWDAIKASCILCGARTLAGALVPLKGTAPTNYNFTSGDYSRTSGLTATDGDERLNANRQSNADPQDDQHMSVYMPVLPEASASVIVDLSASSNTRIQNFSGEYYFRCRSSATSTLSLATGFVGVSRSSSASYQTRADGSTSTVSQASSTPEAVDTFVFNRAIDSYTSTLSFYSIGESVDLAALDTAVSTLVSEIGAAV